MQYTVKPYEEYNHTNLYFISDLHIGHSNVIKFDKRPFKDVNEMHRVMIENWNNKISDTDVVYFLGDLFYKVKSNFAKWFVNQLNGDIKVILGNHDRFSKLASFDRFSDIQSYQRVKVKTEDINQDLLLFHFPILIWDKHYLNSWHLHGHSHHNLAKTDYGKDVYYKRRVIDVGCNGIDYTPLSFMEVKEIMDKRGVDKLDHH
jgi:calcineurin-like phosphoesterase family protein